MYARPIIASESKYGCDIAGDQQEQISIAVPNFNNNGKPNRDISSRLLETISLLGLGGSGEIDLYRCAAPGCGMRNYELGKEKLKVCL
jgi:hypothetical protein